MTFNEYQQKIKQTLANYIREKSIEDRYLELTLGLYEESAEVTSQIRRTIKGGYHEEIIDLSHLSEELGDVLWYISQISSQLHEQFHKRNFADLQSIAKQNIEKTYPLYESNIHSIDNMSISTYAKCITKTYRDDLYILKDEQIRQLSLGLIAEIGTIITLFSSNIIKGTRLDFFEIREKLGDALWHLTALANNYGLDLEEIANQNILKTTQRYDKDGNVQR